MRAFKSRSTAAGVRRLRGLAARRCKEGAGRHLCHRLRRARAQGLRSPRAGLPGQAVRRCALSNRARPRPECDAFEVLRRAGVKKAPAVIFVTAYDEHALRAFEVHALDYLVKPFDDARFQIALDRGRSATPSRSYGAPV